MDLLLLSEDFEILKEVGDSDIIPSHHHVQFSDKSWGYLFIVDDKHYFVSFETKKQTKDDAILVTLKIDFGINGDNEEEQSRLTNFGNPLKVIGSVVGLTKQFISNGFSPRKPPRKKSKTEVYLKSLEIDGKSEFSGDERRNNIYKKYVQKMLSQFGDVVESFNSNNGSMTWTFKDNGIKPKDFKNK